MIPGASTASSEHYVGEAGKRYATEHFADRLAFGRRYQARYFLPYCSSALALLDFGCGDGTILDSLPAREKIGVEVNPACQELIRQANPRRLPPIDLRATLTDVEDVRIDVAISNHCLEHVPSPLDSLIQLRRTLRPGGVLVLVTPFDDWRSRAHRHWRPDDGDRHLWTWSPLNLGNLVQQAGFDVQSAVLKSFAWSPRLFPIYHRLGDGAFRLACRLFAAVKQRREVFCLARKSPAPTVQPS